MSRKPLANVAAVLSSTSNDYVLITRGSQVFRYPLTSLSTGGVDLGNYYTKVQSDNLLSTKVDSSALSNYVTNSGLTTALAPYVTSSALSVLLDTKADVGISYTKVETDSLLGSKANTSSLNSHVSATNNPHSVTAAQVGNSVAQWNASSIQGIPVSATTPTNGQILKFNGTSYVPADDQVGSVGSGEANTASNVGVGGIGVFKQKSGVNLEFRNVNAASNKVSVSLDAANNEIDIDINESNLSLGNIGGTLAVNKGGTGATTVSAARTALDVPSNSDLSSHTSNTSNPHNTTAAQVGAIPISEKGAINGVASLDSSGLVPDSQIPASITRDSELTLGLSTKADTSALNSHVGDINNPHDVTAAQVGNSIAQWNANQIQGISVSATAPTTGQVLKFNGTIYAPANDESGGAGSINLDGLTDVVISSPSVDQRLMFDGTSWANRNDADAQSQFSGGSGRWYPVAVSTATNTPTLGSNVIYLSLVPIRRTVVIDGLGVNVSTAASRMARLGLYTPAGQLVVDAGETSLSGSNGGRSLDISPLVLTPGLYFGATLLDGASGSPLTCISAASSFWSITGSTNISTASPSSGFMVSPITYGALPTTVSGLTTSSSTPLFFLRTA